MIRIAVGGSSANPPQIGHANLLQGLIDSGEFEKIVWIPCGKRNDKAGYAEARHRLEMTKIMLECLKPRQGVTIELREDDVWGTNTPTITWLERIKAENEGAEVWWFTGADTVTPEVDNRCEVERCWHRGGELIRNWPLLIVPRPGYKLPAFTNSYWNKFIRVKKLQTKLMDVSSTLLRTKLARGEAISDLTLPGIENYISSNSLYAVN